MGDIKRRDKKGRLLFIGETQEKNGSYTYRYTDKLGERQKITSWRLTETDVTPPGKKHKKSLREQERDIQIQLAKGIYDNGITVEELVNLYLPTKVNVTHNTRAGYKSVQNVLSKEAFGKQKIGDIKYSDAKRFLIKLQSDGRSYSSVHNIRGVLRPAFQMALEDEMINYNPFSFELADVLINDSLKREAISPKQERQFLEFVQNDKHFSKYYEGIFILFKTGLRISEFCGLTVSDINFEKNTFMVERQLQRTREGKYIIAKTKTKAGKRELPMSKEVRACFEKIIAKRNPPKAEPMIEGYAGFLYFDKNGNPMIGLHWDKYFQHICKKYNSIYKVQMPKVTPHVCRHTYCTNMAKSGIAVATLQYLMGHSDVSITLNVYTHLGLDAAIDELNRIENDNMKVQKKGRKVVGF